MIEVEIRGRLTDAERERLTGFLVEHGTLIEEQDREMILLYDYPGYSKDPIKRDTDIRLRQTNHSCEIMVKHKSGDHNVARHEISLPLGGSDLDMAKQVMKALGFSKGLWMHRRKNVYQYNDVEWSIVTVPGGLSYYEAEQEAEKAEDGERIREHLTKEAERLGLSVLGPDAMRDFIYTLDREVNKDNEW
jgi:predicted adenylyl cyclase CyaB